MSEDDKTAEPQAPSGIPVNRIGSNSSDDIQRRLQKLEIIAERRRKGRSGTIDEWMRAVIITLGDPEVDGLKISKLDLKPFILYLDGRGILRRFMPFMPEHYWQDTAHEMVTGTFPTPRYFATTAHGYDFMDDAMRRKLERMYAHYLSNDDPDKELMYYKKLLPYNVFTAMWVRQKWEKGRKVRLSPKERRDAFERNIRTHDIAPEVAKMMSIVLNENMETVYTEELLERIAEDDPFAEAGDGDAVSNDLFDGNMDEHNDLGDEDTTQEDTP